MTTRPPDDFKKRLEWTPLATGQTAMCRDQEGQWHGPHTIITWGKGYACIFTGDKEIWVPVKRLQVVQHQEEITGSPPEKAEETTTPEP